MSKVLLCCNSLKVYVRPPIYELRKNHTFEFSENYRSLLMPYWEMTHRKHDHTVAKF